MDDPEVQNKLKKYKLRVKLWEKDFKSKFGRIPSKHDIKEARADIKHAYKMYYKMTTSILENTLQLNEDDLNDSLDGLGSQNSFMSSLQNLSDGEYNNNGFSNIQQLLEDKIQFVNQVIDDDAGRRTEFEAEENSRVNTNVWGEHLVKKKAPEPKAELKAESRSILTHVKDKLFANSHFSKRNPRKSLPKSNSKPFKSDTELVKEDFPDFETVLLQKSQKESSTQSKIVEKPNNSKISVDSGWLNRISEDCVEGPESTILRRSSSSISMTTVEKSTSFGISKLKIKSSENQNDSDNSVISNSDDESASFHQSQVVKRRRISEIIDVPTKRNEPVEIESPKSLELSSFSNKESRRSGTAVKYFDSENESEVDPFADNSEEDEFIPDKEKRQKEKRAEAKVEKEIVKPSKSDGKNSRKSKSPRIKHKEQEVQGPEPYLSPLDMLDNIVPRMKIKDLQDSSETFSEFLTSDSKPLKSKPTPKPKDLMTDAEKKAEVAKSKLLKKIASGTLNENFVRIDMNKKIYVRGKKSVNFSRYKKNQWKQKKKALAGPDMDMGGCDGGVLTCYQCGGVGHFARNCKIQADNLLPADVEEDCPFPTLDEAEAMAKSNVRLAHSIRPESLPVTANSIYRKKADETESESDLDPENELLDNEEDNERLVEMGIPKQCSYIGQNNTSETVDKSENFENSDKFIPDLKKQPSYIGHQIPSEFLKKCGILELSVGDNDKVKPLYSLLPDGRLPETPKEVFDALKLFGHSKFRFGQEKAVMRILCGISTLVTLSTGSGKSLCYQLPAYLYRKSKQCITLVVSPLVSLMEDQVHGVPSFLNAQCLHTNQTEKSRQNILALLKSGQVDVLLLSPEAIVAGEKSTTGFGRLLKELPPIAFVCIDEAHCVSQWSHNFRPSYLMISRVIKEKLGIRTILGLTATATAQTRTSIVTHLDVPDGLTGVISDIPLPDNLVLTVSEDKNRESALLSLLRGERFRDLNSIIIYCTRRDECERIASLLRTSLQDTKPKSGNQEAGTKKRKRTTDLVAESYHAGMASSRRRTIQNAFMKGDLRIVVATIAFGMGINKSDIRGIIHYNMPKSYESYVQEVGRAGRDGTTAHCHLFLESHDKSELKRHIYGNSIDRHVIRKLLQNVFLPCDCGSGQKCPGHEVAFSVESTVQMLDIPEENISTLLCYLELDSTRYIQVLSKGYTKCKVLSYGGSKSLKSAAQNSPPLAMAIALDLKRKIAHDESTFVEFPVIEIASSIGWDSGVVKYNLKQLEWTEVPGEKSKKSKITVTFSDLGFRVRAPGNLTDDQLDDTLDLLHSRVAKQERTEIIQLHNVFTGLYSVAHPSYHQVNKPDLDKSRSQHLKKIIRDYFQNETFDDKEYDEIERNDANDSAPAEQIAADVHTLISRYPDNNFTGRAIARIFHGIQSPNYPAVIWGRCKFWRIHQKAEFKLLIRIATEIIVKMRTN